MPLVGWWPLTGEKGKATDYSGNRNHGAVNGNPSRGVAGRGGLQATEFSDSEIELPDLNLSNSSDFSISCWARSRDQNNTQAVIGRFDGSEDWLSLEYQPQNSGFKLIAGHNLQSPTKLFFGSSGQKWKHICITHSSSSGFKCYENGKLDNEGPSPSNDFSTNTGPSIGKRNDGYYPFKGSIGDVRVYNHALTHKQVQEIYRQGNADVASPPGTHKGKAYPPKNESAYYAFNGNTDDQWSNNDAANNGITFTESQVRGQAGAFDGSSSYASASASGFADSVSKFTLTSWVKRDSSTLNWIVDRRNTSESNKGYYMGVQDTGELRGSFKGANENAVSFFTSENIPKNHWTHVSVTYDGSFLTGHVNGVQRVRKSAEIQAPDLSGRDVYIGRQMPAFEPRYFSGQISSVRIYSRALSPSEIQQLYQYGTRGVDMRRHLANSR